MSSNACGTCTCLRVLARVRASPLRIPVIGSIARGDQRLNCSTSMRGPWSRALNSSAVECRVLWNQLPEFVKD